MRRLFALLLVSFALPALAVVPVAPRMSNAPLAPPVDAWIDVQFDDLDVYAGRYRAAFEDELARYQDAPRDLIAQLRASGWSQGDIYAACLVARTVGRPCRVVAEAWTRDRGQRWDSVAAHFGIAAGSNALERMKIAIKSTYQRSGRPLAVPRPD